MIVLDGKKLSQKLEEGFRERIIQLKKKNIVPGLAVILIVDNIESVTYVNMKQKMCSKLGIESQLYSFSKKVTKEKVIQKIKHFNNENSIHGILIQLPLPNTLNQNEIVNAISPNKDVDGLTILNSGKLLQKSDILFYPCTPLGCIRLLDEYNIDVKGMNISIIGASSLVGLPLSLMLLQKGATVTICHIDTIDTKNITIHSDMIITCCGVPELVKKDWVKNDAIVVDIGFNKIEDNSKKGYRLVGDVDYENIKNKVKYITPVPGGIGPMTISSLMDQTIKSCERFAKL